MRNPTSEIRSRARRPWVMVARFCVIALGLLLLGTGAPTAPAGAASVGSSIGANTRLNAGQYLRSSNGSYRLVMQGDGNLVLYTGGTALWASGTYNHAGATALFQADGNLVVYGTSGPLWASHTYTYSGLRLVMQDDGNAVIYQGSKALWSTGTAANQRRCWVNNSCNRSTFAMAILGIQPASPYNGVNAPLTGANTYAVQRWEARENTAASCNPLATTMPEPGATNFNGVGVKNYHNANGQTCWYWGIVGTDRTLLNGRYGPILNVLRNPVNDPKSQCIRLANAVASTPWGSGNFSGLC